MIRFECDYAEGCHESILRLLCDTNSEQTPGYGEDAHCARARELLLAQCGGADADIHFLVGGTQANIVVIASVLRPHQGVICADTGHIQSHETGAIEAAGHRVIPLPGKEGKIDASQVRAVWQAHRDDPTREHTVQPGMVYISHPTECGTLYTRAELTALSAVCRELSLPLYLDGARLGYGLASPHCDVALPDIAGLCDAFYVGGTKVGALFGEAVVPTAPELRSDFRYHIKQRGGMLAKGRMLGLQFEALFSHGLYLQISRHAIALAGEVAAAFEQKGIRFLFPPVTNQLFPILTPRQADALAARYAFCPWGEAEGGVCVRFCTSWATREEDVQQLIADIAALS